MRISLGLITVRMPMEAKILTVQVQYDVPYLWALVDPASEMEERRFRMFMTGQPIEEVIAEDMTYVGTVQMQGGVFVVHLFEVKQ